MITYQEAKIAKETLVDVATPVGSVGCIEFISTRNGVQGAQIVMGNPLCWDDNGWYALTALEIIGAEARAVVDRWK